MVKADFGCSTLFEGMSSAPDSQTKMLGSVPWMAPEGKLISWPTRWMLPTECMWCMTNVCCHSVTRQMPSGRKADIWSLGCTVVEMSTGRRPWYKYKNHLALLYHIGMTRQAPKPDESFSELGRDFLAACFNPDPEHRWTAEKLLSHKFVADASVPLDTPRRWKLHSHLVSYVIVYTYHIQ